MTPLEEYRHKIELKKVLWRIARFIARTGYWPKPGEVKCDDYLDELIEKGCVEFFGAFYVRLTLRGWAAINVVPLEPLLPSNAKARKNAIKAYEAVKRVENLL